MKIRPVILCGGAGTRLWPKSKKNLPKQFIDWGGWTLFEKTLIRANAGRPTLKYNKAFAEFLTPFSSNVP